MTTGQVTWTTTRSLIASKGIMMLLLASIVIMAMSRLNAVVDAFQTTPSFHHHRHHHSEKTATFIHQHNHRQILDPKTTSAMVLCSTPSDNDEAAASSVVGTEGDSLSPSYPIDLPSPLLLASSMVLAIVGTGSVFDLANETPRWGAGPTVGLAAISLTLCAGLFWASILKATAETEADDENYMRGN